MTHEEAALLRGCVPQLEDWLMVWQSLNGSFKLAAQHLSTVRWLGNSRGEDKVSELAATSMVQVMAERARHRQVLRKAASITLQTDDKGRWRTVRFKASYFDEQGEALLGRKGSGLVSKLSASLAVVLIVSRVRSRCS